ncbi:hypothetical protein [Duganella sp. BuS-21]|uniref:hypothetical protein n=1 Tax=Duganella sp. BuS-21 TaxID=2943848 RepID=UPI0035A5BD46
MQYDFSIPAGGGVDIQATGSYIKYLSGLGKIRVRVSSGGYIDLIPGQGIRVSKEFGSLNVSDRSGNANLGIVLAGPFEFSDDTINGVVSIVDGGKNSTLSKNCFLGYTPSANTAGSFNFCALINPTDSQKNVIVESVAYSVVAAGPVQMYLVGFNAALNVRAQNKYAAVGGGVASLAKIEANGGADLALLGTPFRRDYVAANMPRDFKPAEPLIVPPGMALIVANMSWGQYVYVNWEFREDPV